MAAFTKVASNFSFRLSSNTKQKLAEAPQILKPVGVSVHIPTDRLYWMTYENHTKTDSPYHHADNVGLLSVTQNTHAYLLDDTLAIAEEMSLLFPKVNWDPAKFHFMRTIGSVYPHRGATRPASLNIGLENCNCAVTQTAKNNRTEDFDPTNLQLDTYTMQVGDIYLLDVLTLHAVETSSHAIRYQLTYMCEQSYSELLPLLT